MDDFLAVAISLAGGIAVYELYIWMRPICRAITQLAVRLLPPEKRERYEEEWQSHLGDLPNSLVTITTTSGFLFSALRLRLPAIGRAINAWFVLEVLLRWMRSEARFAQDMLRYAAARVEKECDLEQLDPADQRIFAAPRAELRDQWDAVKAKGIRLNSGLASLIVKLEKEGRKFPPKASLDLTLALLQLTAISYKLLLRRWWLDRR